MATADALTGGRAWWVAPTYKVANEGWVLVQRLARQISGATINRTDRTVTMPDGGTVEVRSADNPDSLVGAGLTLAVLDEAADMAPEAWGESLRPALADRRGKALFITTPKGFSNWTYTDLWLRADIDPVGWAHWQMPTWTNPYILESEIDAMRHEMSTERFAQEIAAEFVTMEGQVFPDFARGRHVIEIGYDERLPVCVGLDFGYRTCGWVAAQVDTGGTMRIFADGEWKNISTGDAAGRLSSMPWGDKVELIGCDPAGDAVNLQTGIDDVRVLRAAFPSARVSFSTAPPHRSPEWRASKMRDLLWSAAGTSRLAIGRQCVSTIRMFEASVYPKLRPGSGEKAEPVKDGVVDHIRDALGYLIVNRFHREPVRGTVSKPW